MSLQNIVDNLEADTSKELESIDSKIELDLATLEAGYQEKITEAKKALLDQAEAEAVKSSKMLLFAEQSDFKKCILRRKRQLIDRVYADALKKLKNISEAEYKNIVIKLINELPLGKGKIVPASGREKITKEIARQVSDKLIVAETTISSVGGFVWQSEKMNVNYTFEQLIAELREATEIKIATELFKEI